MFIPGIVQALVAALTFGIVLNAASAAVFLFAKGHGSKIFRDGLRLVLITFLASAALWAQIDFAALTIDPTAISGCQVAVIFATIFDQLARFAIEQYLLWAINSNAKTPTGAMIPQAVIGTRFILGAVFVGFQKPQIATVCVSKTDVLPIGVVIMITDFLIIGMLAFRANSLGLITEARSGRPSSQNKKAVLWTMVGFAVWTAGSIPLLLGAENIELIFRTAVPATALSLLVGIVTGFSDSLLPPRPQQATHPDAQSPRNISSSRDIGTSDSDYPPTRYEDLKAGTITTVSTFNQPRDAPRPDVPRGADGALPIIAGSVPGQAMIGVGGVPVQGQLFPPIRAQTAPVRESKRIEIKQPNKQYKRSIFDRGPGSNIKHAISNPILQESGERNPLNKIATIDLATAAQNDRERRDNDMATMQQSPSLIAQRPAPRPPAITPEEALKRAQSTKRKEVGPASPPPAEPQPLKSAGLMSNPPATTSSAQLSPGVEELRRRSPRVSPRQSPEPVQQNETETRPVTPPKQSAPASSISPPRPPRPERPLSPFETMERSGSQKTVDRSMSQKTMTIDRTASQKSTATTMTRTMSPSTGLVPPPPPRSAARLMSPTKKPDLPSTWPIQSAVDPAIRPSRNKPLSPKGQDASAAPGLQRRPTTTGLPSNPRAMTMRPLPKDAVSKEQTVLFVNNIQYNDPTGVQNIIQGAVSQAAKTPLGLQSPGSALKSSGSIVHRPRPIPRQPGKDRPIFPAEDTPNHKRSKSGGSIISRKSILLSNPGSPTQLPPLPPPPKSAGAPVRPLPNDTKSMTFDEKMDLFFPRPPSSSDGSSRPRESIPEMPVLPAAYKPESNAVAEDRGGWDTSRVQSKQSSNRSTKTSVRTESILDIEEPQHALNYPRNTSKFSVDTSIVSGRDRDSWIPDLPVDDRTRGKSYDGVKRQSSPVLPVRNPSLSEFSETRTHDEVATTNWGSIHSPVAAVNIQEVTHMPKPTWIQPRDVSMISHNDGKEVIDIMLDASVEHERDFVPSVQEINEGPADLPDVSVANRGARWHRRVGDACATFSERDEKVNSRRMPPPRALQLKSPTRRNNAVVLQVAEPSPLESPQHAYEMIQAQLKKLEEPTRDSYESQGQRIRLLESLEAEMGQQESQWHEMQHGLTRDSLSTVGTTSVRNSQQEPSNVSVHSRDSSLHSTIAADRRASRRARIQSGASLSKSSYEDLRSASSSSSGNNRTSLWEQRLADAQMEYMENATELLAKRNLNFLSVSKARVSAQLGSPTPPDTDESDGVDAQILATLMPKERAAPAGQLWAPISPVYSEREPTLLWRPAHDVANKTSKSGADAALPGLSVRPAARKSAEPLLIESVQLWQPDHTAAKKLRNSTSSLWRTSFVAEPPKPARPVTQRPPRRSKRITALPDILENPEPLPDKRGTLGIFQFPWGERSDTATVQPRPSHMFMAMPGTMSTGGTAVRAALEARAQQLQAQEYSSSFFDDYDEEEEGDDEVSDINEDDESDDGFDETTLWEIASLLQSDQVPSKNSLLPQPTYYRPDSLMEEEEYISQSSEYPSDDEKTAEGEDDTKHDSLVMSAVAEELPTPPKPSSLLWTGKPKRYVSVRLPPGLLQPDARTWATYVDTNPIPRVQAQRPEPATIYSTTLWSAPMPAAQKSVGLLWSQQTVKTDNKTKAPTMKTMWIAPVVIVEKEANGLFDPSEKRITFRTTSASPVGLSMSSTARVTVEALPVLTSTSLWASQQLSTKTLWALPAVVIEAAEGLFDASHKRAVFRTTTATPVGLAMSSSTARVTETALPVLTSTSLWTASPAALEAQDWISVGSANSSGRSTPTLDTASTRSLATEAVSDFDPLPAVEAKRPTWWENNAEKPQERLQRTEVTPADWEAALNEAIAATAPLPSPLVRTVATPEQWADALNEAIGTTSTPASLDRTAASPAQWEDALNEAIAASSYVPEVPVQEVQQQQYFEQPEFEQQQYNEQPQFDQEPYYEQQQFDQQAFDQQEFERREYERYMNEQRLFEQQMYNQRLLEEQMYQQQQYYGQQQQQYEPQYDAQYQPLYTEPQYEPQLDQPIEPQFEQQQVYEPEPEFLQPTLYVEPATEPKEQLFEPEQPVSVSPAKSPLWSAPEVTVSSETGIMWIAPAKPLLHAHDTAPLTPEDSESRQLRLKRSKTPPPPSTIVSFEGQGMWKSLSAPVTPGFPPLWSAPEVTVSEDTGIMWIAPAKPPLHAHDTAPLTPEDSVSRQLRLKRSKTPPPPSTIVSFEGQGMWKSLSAPVTPGFPPMWSAPEITAPKDTGIMWIRPAKPARHSYDTAPLTPEDSESRNLRLKRSKAQSTGGLVNFDGTAMWNHEGADASRIAPLGGGRNWIEGEIFRI